MFTVASIIDGKDVNDMLSAVKNGYANRPKWMRRLALLFLIIFIAISLTAQITIIVNANHECIGDGCPICQLIRNAETLLTQIGKTLIADSTLYAVFLFISVFVSVRPLLFADLFTLVNIKARLNI